LRRGAAVVLGLLASYGSYVDSCLPTFRDNSWIHFYFDVPHSYALVNYLIFPRLPSLRLLTFLHFSTLLWCTQFFASFHFFFFQFYSASLIPASLLTPFFHSYSYSDASFLSLFIFSPHTSWYQLRVPATWLVPSPPGELITAHTVPSTIYIHPLTDILTGLLGPLRWEHPKRRQTTNICGVTSRKLKTSTYLLHYTGCAKSPCAPVQSRI
jgi:hypothetical protein